MTKKPLVIFDGICNLCNGAVNFILRHDSKKQFRFVSLQSEAGEIAVQQLQIPAETDSIIFYQNNQLFFESDAVIEIIKLLPIPWKWAKVFKIIPKKPRDLLYRWIAHNRYRWFGKRQTCRLPLPEEKLFFPDATDLEF